MKKHVSISRKMSKSTDHDLILAHSCYERAQTIEKSNNHQEEKEQMTSKERDLLNAIKESKESGHARYQVYDFNAGRPQSEDFWQELEKIGKVERNNSMFCVDF